MTPQVVQDALARLDPEQAAAVQAIRTRPVNLRITAPAGSGKTRVLVTALAALVVLDQRDPRTILASTFTRKAANEMQERLRTLIPANLLELLRVDTFHAYARQELAVLQPDRWSMASCCDLKNPQDVPTSYTLWRAVVGWTKDGIPGTGEPSLDLNGADPKVYATAVDRLKADGHRHSDAGIRRTIAEHDDSLIPSLDRLLDAWTMFEDAKEALGAWDFSDCLLALLAAFDRGEVPRRDLVLVDEAQDNNRTKLAIAQKAGRRIVLIGDGNQSIYRFTRAFPELFLTAHEVLSAETVGLRRNYRSWPKLVAAGNRIAATFDASWQIGEAAVAARAGDEQGVIDLLPGDDALDQAQRVAEDILAALTHEDPSRRLQPRNIAILTRTNAAGALFEGTLMAKRIPVVRLGGMPFFERPDVLAFLGYVILGVVDSWPAFERIANRPKRYLGRDVLRKIGEGMDKVGLIPAISTAGAAANGKTRTRIRDLVQWLTVLRKTPWPQRASLIFKLLDDDLRARREAADAPDDDLGAAIRTCLQLAGRFADPLDLIRYADASVANAVQRSETDVSKENRVVVSTAHRSKALEWPLVYVSIPAGELPMESETKVIDPGEELRLAYVAVTRAADRLVLTWPDADMDRQAAIGPSAVLKLVDPEGWQRVMDGGRVG